MYEPQIIEYYNELPMYANMIDLLNEEYILLLTENFLNKFKLFFQYKNKKIAVIIIKGLNIKLAG